MALDQAWGVSNVYEKPSFLLSADGTGWMASFLSPMAH